MNAKLSKQAESEDPTVFKSRGFRGKVKCEPNYRASCNGNLLGPELPQSREYFGVVLSEPTLNARKLSVIGSRDRCGYQISRAFIGGGREIKSMFG
jgi:hypothetical protein